MIISPQRIGNSPMEYLDDLNLVFPDPLSSNIMRFADFDVFSPAHIQEPFPNPAPAGVSNEVSSAINTAPDGISDQVDTASDVALDLLRVPPSIGSKNSGAFTFKPHVFERPPKAKGRPSEKTRTAAKAAVTKSAVKGKKRKTKTAHSLERLEEVLPEASGSGSV
jgi:hypothetical protein